MNSTSLSKLYAVNAETLRMNLEGTTHDESVAAPGSGGNCLNWIVGHLALYRNTVLEFLERAPVWGGEGAAIYRRGESMTDPAKALALEALVDAFQRSVEPVAEGFAAITPEQLAADSPHQFPGGLRTVGEALAFLHFHEAYHIGQISMLRRLAGKPGVIA